MPNRYFKTYKEAWEFVHKIATGGYDHDKQAEMCEAFRMMYEATTFMDQEKTNQKGVTDHVED